MVISVLKWIIQVFHVCTLDCNFILLFLDHNPEKLYMIQFAVILIVVALNQNHKLLVVFLSPGVGER